jgi:hypothetical protein
MHPPSPAFISRKATCSHNLPGCLSALPAYAESFPMPSQRKGWPGLTSTPPCACVSAAFEYLFYGGGIETEEDYRKFKAH